MYTNVSLAILTAERLHRTVLR